MLKRSKYTDEELNSGLLIYGYDEHIREGGKLIESRFVEAGKLNFKTMSLRESDYNLYESIDRIVTKKVKTYYVPDLERKYKVIIENEKFDITSIDPDNDKRYIYLYLQRVM